MRIDVITLFPEIIETYVNTGIIGRALKNNLLKVNYVNLRDFSNDKHKRVDDYPYGGGPGMLIKPEPLYNAIKELKNDDTYIIYLTPKGNLLSQKKSNSFINKKHLLLIAGHYEGIDQRIIDMYVDEEISIGDYVLTGGELPCLVMLDSIVRLIPGVLGSNESIIEESHNDNLLEYPQYTRPEKFMGAEVPKILLSGNHKKIKEWRRYKSIENTIINRADLIKDNKIIEEFMKLKKTYK